MVGRQNQSPRIQGSVDQPELFDFTTYPERWAFTTRRLKGKLITKGVGWYAASKQLMYECEFEYHKDGWILTHFGEYEKGERCDVPGEVGKDMYREFAYHKASWLADRNKKRQLQGEMTRSVRRMS